MAITRYDVVSVGGGDVVEVTVVRVVVARAVLTVDVRVVVAASGTVTVKYSVTTLTDVVRTGELTVMVVTDIEGRGSSVEVEALATAKMQEHADEYSSKLGQLEAMGNEAAVEDGETMDF